jgi:hypothetical protein
MLRGNPYLYIEKSPFSDLRVGGFCASFDVSPGSLEKCWGLYENNCKLLKILDILETMVTCYSNCCASYNDCGRLDKTTTHIKCDNYCKLIPVC